MSLLLVAGLFASSRLWAQPAANTPVTPTAPLSPATLAKLSAMTPLYDGKTLDGWIQNPPFATTLSGDDIVDLALLAKKLTAKSDAVSAFLGEQLDETVRTNLAAFSPASTNARSVRSALARNLNKFVNGTSLFDANRFRGVRLRVETAELRGKNPQGQELARFNRLLLEDAYPTELAKSAASSWIVKDSAMASTGGGRGVIYTKEEFSKFRLVFTMRHLGGPPSDHAPCVLIFCTTPPPGEKGLDALAGIQFQPPNGGSWDYRPGKNNSGRGLFTRVLNPRFNSKEWHQVELLVDADAGTATMAVAQPPGTKAVEVLQFKDPTAGKKGPIAWQMHNAGLFDEFKDVRIEVEPKESKLITAE
jgi:hypothetical protein